MVCMQNSLITTCTLENAKSIVIASTFFIKMADWKVTTTTLGLSQKVFFCPNVHVHINPVSVQCRYVRMYVHQGRMSEQRKLSLHQRTPSIHVSLFTTESHKICLSMYVCRSRQGGIFGVHKETDREHCCLSHSRTYGNKIFRLLF